jgi:HAE1 family hydrophobic/amphiphilic exporter-1
MKLRILAILAGLATPCFLGAQANPQDEVVPPVNRLAIPPRIGVIGSVEIGLPEVVQRVLASDRDLAISRIVREEAAYSVKGAKGAFDPRLGFNASRQRSVTPVTSLLGGSADGKLAQESYIADPSLSGAFPAFGGTYKLDFSSARQTSDSTFNTLNPQFPSSLTLNLTQPLWRGLLFDDNRHRLAVAKKNVQLTDEQFRQRVADLVTQAVQSYWELYYAIRNLQVQTEAVGLAEQQDGSNRRQLQQGLLAPVDVVATQTQIATFQQSLFAAQQAVTVAENALKILMLPDRGDLLWGMALQPSQQPDTEVAAPSLDDAVKAALKGRPELAQAAVSIEINELDSRLSRQLAKPQVDAVASFGTSGLAGTQAPTGPNPLTSSFAPFVNSIDALNALAGLPPLVFGSTSSSAPAMFIGDYGHSLGSLTGGKFTSATIGVQISVPLRNRTAEAQVEVSAAEGRRLRMQRQQVEMAIEQDVRNTLQAAASAKARLEAAISASENAERQYSSEQRQFQAGTSTVFLVLQRQTDLIAARTREIRARADLGQAAAGLDHATARTIEAQGIQIK